MLDRNQKMKENFETMRGIVREFQGQLMYGELRDNENIPQTFSQAFGDASRLYLIKKTYDCFTEVNNVRAETNYGYFYRLNNNLSPQQINELHQFVIDFALILMNHLYKDDIQKCILLSEGYFESPKFKVGDTDEIRQLLSSMLVFSQISLGVNMFQNAQGSLFSKVKSDDHPSNDNTSTPPEINFKTPMGFDSRT